MDSAAGFSFAWAVTKNAAGLRHRQRRGFSFTPDDNGTYLVSLTATDKDGGGATTTKTITVTNVAPTTSAAT